MKSIKVPDDITYTLKTPQGKVEQALKFGLAITALLDQAEVFGTRIGARKAVLIEKALNDSAADGVLKLTDDQHSFLMEAINGNSRNPQSAFTWIPAAAKAMEVAGWFELIEKAA